MENKITIKDNISIEDVVLSLNNNDIKIIFYFHHLDGQITGYLFRSRRENPNFFNEIILNNEFIQACKRKEWKGKYRTFFENCLKKLPAEARLLYEI